MNVLITGSSGFIGRNLKEQLINKYKIYAPTSSELNLLEENIVSDFFRKNKIDVVLHTATWNATRNSSKDTTKVLRNNLKMFNNVARCNKTFGKMIYFGSGAEYNREFWSPKMSEDYFDFHVPDDDYGFSKYLMRKFTENSKNIYDLVLFGVFGKYEDWEIRFISNACCKAAWNLPITIKQNVYFDYLHINDLVKIIEWFLVNDCNNKVYNVCTGTSIDLLSIAEKILDSSNKKLEIKVAQDGLGTEYSGDNRRLTDEIGNFRFQSLDKSVDELYGWYESNKQSINKNKLLVDK